MRRRGRIIEELGGEEGCENLAAAFYARVATTPELNPLFPGKTLRCATEELSAFLIQFLDGDESRTQKRWWLSLRESHARFKISESQRLAWLEQMQATLGATSLADATQDALFQWFVSSSIIILGGEAEAIRESELAERWNWAIAMDEFVADIVAERDQKAIESLSAFASRPSQFVGVLARMLQTHRSALAAAVVEAIDQDSSLKSVAYAGRTLLHYAAGFGYPDIVRQLLRLGVDANVLDAGDHPPLYRVANECAGETGPEIVRILVQAGAEINHAGGSTRATPLHMAARRGFVEIAKVLLELGADPDARDSKGCTPLERAVNCRKPEIVQFLKANVPILTT